MGNLIPGPVDSEENLAGMDEEKVWFLPKTARHTYGG